MFERNNRNVFIALIIFLLVASHVYYSELEYRALTILAVVNIIIFMFQRNSLDPNDPYQPFIAQPLQEVCFSDSHLKIKDELIELAKVEKVVLELQEGKGILQLPYNNGGKINISFPAKYLFKLKSQFQQHLPDVKYIS